MPLSSPATFGILSGSPGDNAALAAALAAKADLVGGKVPAEQLPSYVDDVLEYANLAAMPGTGATGIIYVTLDDNKTYRWSGSAYVEISAGGGSSLNFPAVYYVDTANGNDGTGAVGNPALPYATAQAAFDDWQTAGIAGRMHLMRTPTHAGGITLAAGMAVPLHITGEGYAASKLGGITASGAAGADGDADLSGVSGYTGPVINITSDWSVNLGAVAGNGGKGGDGGLATSVDTSGGAGGAAPPTRLINAVVESVELLGGNGGNGQNYSGSDVGGEGGSLTSVILEGLRVVGAAGINMDVGVGGSGSSIGSAGAPGPLWAVGCLVDFSFIVIGSVGFVSGCQGTTISISGTVTDAGNNVTAPTYPAF